MRQRSPWVRGIVTLVLFAGAAISIPSRRFAAEPADKQPPRSFDGYPEINVHRPGERSFPTITSDGVKGLVRPKWTRAMADLGGWPAMHRFKDEIFLVYPNVDGHRGKKYEGAGAFHRLTSRDEGKTWTRKADQPFFYTPPDPCDSWRGAIYRFFRKYRQQNVLS